MPDTIRLAVTCLLLLLSSAAYAKESPVWADSLLNNTSQLNPEEAARLVVYLQHLRETERDADMRWYCSAALTQCAWYLIQKREWYLASPLIDMAGKYFQGGDSSIYYTLQSAKVGVLIETENYPRAERLLRGVETYYRQQRDTLEWLKSCMNLCRVYLAADRRKEAQTYYNRIVKMSADPRYSVYFAIAVPYAEQLENDSSLRIDLINEAIKVSADNGFYYLYSSLFTTLANYYKRSGEYQSALSNAQKGIRYARKYEQAIDLVRGERTLASIYALQKEYALAYTAASAENQTLLEIQTKGDKAIYDDVNIATSLMGWCTDNVPLDDDTPGRNTGRAWPWVAVSIAAIGIAVIVVVRTRMRDRSRTPEEPIAPANSHPHPETREPDPRLAEENRQLKEKLVRAAAELERRENELAQYRLKADDTLRQLLAQDILHRSVNPMLDRLKQRLRELSKSGNTEHDSAIRQLLTGPLQDRWADRDSDALEQARHTAEAFRERLKATGAQLTPADLRLATYLRAGLTIREICMVDGVQAKSVNQARYRLRKALGLTQDASLEAYLATI